MSNISSEGAPHTWVLAIDYGTTNTSAAANDGRTVQALSLFGSPAFPSCTLLDADGRIRTGTDAEQSAVVRIERFVATPKRHFSDDTLVIGGVPRRAVDLVAATLRAVYDEACRTLGSKPGRVVLTRPARWGADQIGRLLEAAELAGIGHPQVVAEPVAAAAGFARKFAVASHAPFAVFDLGGGTLDIAVIQPGPSGSPGRVLAAGGVDPLGGEDFDAALTQHVLRSPRLAGPHGDVLRAPTERRHHADRRTLQLSVRRAKEALSRHETATFGVPGFEDPVTLTRDELDAVIAPHAERAVGELLRVIGEVGLPPDHLDAVFLAGGSSRAPLVGRAIRDRLPGVRVETVGDPKAVTAEGATTLVDFPAPLTPPPPREPTIPQFGAGRPKAPRRRGRVPVAMGVMSLGLAGLAGAGWFVSQGGEEGDPAPPTTWLTPPTEATSPPTDPTSPPTTEAPTPPTTATVAPPTTNDDPDVDPIEDLRDRFPLLWEDSCQVGDPIPGLEAYVEHCFVSDDLGTPLLFIGQIVEDGYGTESYLDDLELRDEIEPFDRGTWSTDGVDQGSYLDFFWVVDGYDVCRAWGDFDSPFVGWICGSDIAAVIDYWGWNG